MAIQVNDVVVSTAPLASLVVAVLGLVLVPAAVASLMAPGLRHFECMG